MVEEFISVLERLLGVKRVEFNLQDRWAKCPPAAAQGKSLKKYMAKVRFLLRYVREITDMIRVLSGLCAMSTSIRMKTFDRTIEIRQERILMSDLLRRFDGNYSLRLDVRYIILNAIVGPSENLLQKKNTHGDGQSLTSSATGLKKMSWPQIRIPFRMLL